MKGDSQGQVTVRVRRGTWIKLKMAAMLENVTLSELADTILDERVNEMLAHHQVDISHAVGDERDI